MEQQRLRVAPLEVSRKRTCPRSNGYEAPDLCQKGTDARSYDEAGARGMGSARSETRQRKDEAAMGEGSEERGGR
nr:unnamed protein product [Digitaria exilis]